jgi:hypothetical protein
MNPTINKTVSMPVPTSARTAAFLRFTGVDAPSGPDRPAPRPQGTPRRRQARAAGRTLKWLKVKVPAYQERERGFYKPLALRHLRTKTGDITTAVRLPDTVDPRGPKGK